MKTIIIETRATISKNVKRILQIDLNFNKKSNKIEIEIIRSKKSLEEYKIFFAHNILEDSLKNFVNGIFEFEKLYVGKTITEEMFNKLCSEITCRANCLDEYFEVYILDERGVVEVKKTDKTKKVICNYCGREIKYKKPYVRNGEEYCDKDCWDQEVEEEYSHYRH